MSVVFSLATKCGILLVLYKVIYRLVYDYIIGSYHYTLETRFTAYCSILVIVVVYLLVIFLSLLYQRHRLSKSTNNAAVPVKATKLTALIRYTFQFMLLPSYNILCPLPLPAYFHITYYCMEYVLGFVCLVVESYGLGNSNGYKYYGPPRYGVSSWLELLGLFTGLYTLGFILSILLYFLFKWRLHKYTQNNES